MTDADRRNIALNLWVARGIPFVLAGVVGYATYVVVALLCVNYLLVKHDDSAATILILVLYSLFFVMTAASFFRLVYITSFDPPYVALGPATTRDKMRRSEKYNTKEDGVGSGEYNPGYPAEQGTRRGDAAAIDIDSPGLEMFYSKDVFVCEMDGKPKWCSTCGNWKPDRAHHCSSSGRCIMKMDHFCPWVGGPIGENNFKFFIQFTGYTALYCIHILVVMAIYIRQQHTNTDERINNHFISTLVLAAFFGLFTAGMTGTSIDLAVRNQTQVEKLGAQTRMHILAVLKPSQSQLARADLPELAVMSYPEITYPLDASSPPQDRWQSSHRIPDAKANERIRQPEFIPVSQSSQKGQEHSFVLSSGSEGSEILSNPTLKPAPEPKYNAKAILESLPPSRDLSSGSTAVTVTAPTGSEADIIRQENHWPSGEIAARDKKATRTFAVLKMLEQGDNPWDLGSALLNWQSIMGTNVLDWFLPIRRSPCCQHDDPESYYQIGPVIDSLRAKYNFVLKTEIQAGGRPRRTERSHSTRRAKNATESSQKDGRAGHRKKRRRKHHSEKQRDSEPPIDMRDLNEHR